MELEFKYNKKRLSTFRIIIGGFLAVIIIGALLLMLPFATRAGEHTSFLDALFTATSALCVTGLVIHDTATHWTLFGQFVIIMLIQIGGMGVITVSAAIAMISGKKIGLMQRSTMQEAIAAPNIGGIVSFTRFILKITFAVEAAGALCMAPVFIKDFGFFRGIWYAVFHSVSAFCNAGFDLMGVRGKFSSLTSYASNPVINIVVFLLIFIGGIGFLTWKDIQRFKLKLGKYRLQSKLNLTMALILITLPLIFFMTYEFNLPQWDGHSTGEKFLYSLFQTMTPRTAGFNTIDLNALSETGKTIVIVLMLIGGASGSTAGGMKVTTIAVMLVMAFSMFIKKSDVNCYGRRIPDETLKNAATVLMLYVFMVITGGLLINCIDGVPLMASFFETASAIATVGLTLGITPELSAASHIILIILMYMGRVGGMTIIFAALPNGRVNASKLPREQVTVG